MYGCKSRPKTALQRAKYREPLGIKMLEVETKYLKIGSYSL